MGLLSPGSWVFFLAQFPPQKTRTSHSTDSKLCLHRPPAWRGLAHIFAYSPSLYKTEPQPRPLGEAVAYRSRRQTSSSSVPCVTDLQILPFGVCKANGRCTSNDRSVRHPSPSSFVGSACRGGEIARTQGLHPIKCNYNCSCKRPPLQMVPASPRVTKYMFQNQMHISDEKMLLPPSSPNALVVAPNRIIG